MFYFLRKGLEQDGHLVSIASHSKYAEKIRRERISFGDIGGDYFAERATESIVQIKQVFHGAFGIIIIIIL